MRLMNSIKKAQMLNNDCQYVLLNIDGFLCTEDKFMRFSIDDENLEYLKKVLDGIFRHDNYAKVLACAYKDQLIDSEKKEFMYADSIWISTNASEEYLTDIFNKDTKEISPSDISDYSTISEMIENGILFVGDDGHIKKASEVFNSQEIGNIKVIYWD